MFFKLEQKTKLILEFRILSLLLSFLNYEVLNVFFFFHSIQVNAYTWVCIYTQIKKKQHSSPTHAHSNPPITIENDAPGLSVPQDRVGRIK